MTKSSKKTSNSYKQTDWKKQLSSISIPDFKDDIFQRKKPTWTPKGGPKRRRVSGTGKGLPKLKTLGNKMILPRKDKGRSVGRRTR
jgi:hypothetical protein